MTLYHVYYMDNDRRKRIVLTGLPYWKAVKNANRLQFEFNTPMFYEPIF